MGEVIREEATVLVWNGDGMNQSKYTETTHQLDRRHGNFQHAELAAYCILDNFDD